jgi:HEAT repeat protein
MATTRWRAALLLAWLLPGIPRDVSAQVPFEQAIRDLASADASVRLRATLMLKEVAYQEAAVPLAVVTDPHDEVQLEDQLTAKSAAMRGIAMEGIARLGDPSALPQIQTAIAGERDDRASRARAFAAAMLSDVPIDPIAETLVRPRLRDQAKAYLVELAECRWSAFSRYLEDPDPHVRTDFLDALGLGGDPTALPLLEPLTKDCDPQVVRAAAHAIPRLRHER